MTTPEKNITWHSIAPETDLWEGVGLSATINGTPVGIYKLDDGLHAMEDLCPHAFALLSGGFIENGCVECPVHQALFDLRTGALVSGPGQRDLITFPVRVTDGMIEVAL
jgi:nitrite reductase/ring-hydroxylating ferredoxin subunit